MGSDMGMLAPQSLVSISILIGSLIWIASTSYAVGRFSLDAFTLPGRSLSSFGSSVSYVFVVTAGALWLLSTTYTVGRVLLSTYVLPGKPLTSFGPKGSYALITGGSDGLGKEFANQIAAKGFNLILASRTKSKLDAVAQAVKSKYPSIEVETIAIDFSKANDDDYARLDKLMDGKRIAILVNNVGQSHNIPVPFADTERQELESIININVHATLRVTQLVLPKMQAQKKGLVLTMGSFGGLTPTPLLATYSGSKAFLQQWSTALAAELKGSGVTVHFVQAYLITSGMSKIKRASTTVPSEKDFVRSTLGKIGRRGGSVGYVYSGSPYWSHAVAAFIVIYLVGPMSRRLLNYNRNMHVDIRRRALKKIEREANKAK